MSKNTTKTNATVNFNALYDELINASTKVDMINAYKNVGIECTTAPTTTPNKNDLYAQFNRVNCGDLSRIQVTSKSIKLFVTDAVASAFTDLQFDNCNDGGKRTKKTTIAKSLDNFNMVINTFIASGVIKVNA